jgi:exosortase
MYSYLPIFIVEWKNNPNCEHVALSLPIAILYLLNNLYNLFKSSPLKVRQTSRQNLIIYGTLIISIGFIFCGTVIDEAFVSGLGFVLMIPSTFAMLYGTIAFRACAFPCLLLFFSIPFPPFLLRQIFHIYLQRASAACSAGILSGLGIDAYISGTVVTITGTHDIQLNVIERCSGLKFITVLIFGSLLIGNMKFPNHIKGNLLLLICSAVIAFLINVIRLVITGIIAEKNGIADALRFLHEGYSIFILYAIGMSMIFLTATAIQEFIYLKEAKERESE